MIFPKGLFFIGAPCRVEPFIVTQGLVTATHMVPSVPASLVAPPK